MDIARRRHIIVKDEKHIQDNCMKIICSLTILELCHPLFPPVICFTIATSPTVPLPPLLQSPIHPHSACYQRLMGEKEG